MLASLKRGYPEAEIDWLVQKEFAPAVAAHPDLARAVLFDRRTLGRWWGSSGLKNLRSLLEQLRQPNYDLVIDAQGLARSGLFAAATGAPRRIGLADARELGWLGLTEGVHAPRDLHTVDRMMLLARVAGGVVGDRLDMRLYVAADDREWAERELAASGSFALLAPTTRWPAKQWPQERFAALAEHMLANGVERVVFVGSSGEAAQCRALAELATKQPRVINMVGRTTVGQLMGIVQRAAIVVASDSAALHMAVGLDRPMVGLFGPTRVDLVGPYGHDRDAIQHVQPGESLDHKNAAAGAMQMARISVDEVAAAVRARLHPAG